VLEDAVRTVQSFVPGSRRTRRLLQEIDEWFASDDVRDPFAFLRVCDALGIDAAHLREGLVRWRECQQAFGEATHAPAEPEPHRLAS
jgi:hypothetical protein